MGCPHNTSPELGVWPADLHKLFNNRRATELTDPPARARVKRGLKVPETDGSRDVFRARYDDLIQAL